MATGPTSPDAENSAADDCEGTGLGGNSQYTAQLTGAVNGQVTVPGLISAGCPAGTYTVSVTLMATSGFGFTVTQALQVLESSQSIVEPDTPTPTATPTDTPTPTATATRHGYSHRHGYDRYGHADADTATPTPTATIEDSLQQLPGGGPNLNPNLNPDVHANAPALREDRRSAFRLRSRPANSLQHDLRRDRRLGPIWLPGRRNQCRQQCCRQL